MMYASHLSASFFFHSRSLKLQWQPRSYASSTCGMKINSSEESRQSRAKLPGPATGQWLYLSKTAGGSGSKTSNTSQKFIVTAMLHFPRPTWNSQNQRRQICKVIICKPKRELQNASSSSGRCESHNPKATHRETECSQKAMMRSSICCLPESSLFRTW